MGTEDDNATEDEDLGTEEDDTRDDDDEATGPDGNGEDAAEDDDEETGTEDAEDEAGAEEEFADDCWLVSIEDELTGEEDAPPPGLVGVTDSELELELELTAGGFEGDVPLALAPPPPPQAAVNKGAKKATASVVLRSVYCQLKLFTNWRRSIKPSSIRISPSSIFSVISPRSSSRIRRSCCSLIACNN